MFYAINLLCKYFPVAMRNLRLYQCTKFVRHHAEGVITTARRQILTSKHTCPFLFGSLANCELRCKNLCAAGLKFF